MGAKKTLPPFYALGTPGPPVAGQSVVGVTIYTQNQTSTYVYNLDSMGIQFTWTGTPTGTISILACNDNINFIPLTLPPSMTQPAGSAGGFLLEFQQFPYAYIQIKYANTAGSGTLLAIISGKDLS